MRTIKLSRSGFPAQGNFSWPNYFIWILEKKYNVVVDNDKPDILICSNIGNDSEQIDFFTNQRNMGAEEYPESTKKVFVTGEAISEGQYLKLLNTGYYCLGF